MRQYIKYDLHKRADRIGPFCQEHHFGREVKVDRGLERGASSNLFSNLTFNILLTMAAVSHHLNALPVNIAVVVSRFNRLLNFRSPKEIGNIIENGIDAWDKQKGETRRTGKAPNNCHGNRSKEKAEPE